jgi:hypothetical protein
MVPSAVQDGQNPFSFSFWLEKLHPADQFHADLPSQGSLVGPRGFLVAQCITGGQEVLADSSC